MDYYLYNCHIDASMVDNHANLRLDGLFNIKQTMITEYLKQFNVDNVMLKQNFNSAWLITKSVININKMPIWGDDIVIKSYVIEKRSAKIILETKAYDKLNNILFYAHDEMCPINLLTRRIIRLDDIKYNPIIIESNNELLFELIETNDLNISSDILVKYTDIDFTNHTNNVSYIRFIINDLGLDFFEKYNISKINVRYLNESRINDKLTIYKHINDRNIVLLIKNNDTDIFSIKIDYIEK